MLRLLALRINIMLIVDFTYINNLLNFYQSSSSGSLTLVARKAMVVWMSFLALVLENRS
jgi:hypothetical protein